MSVFVKEEENGVCCCYDLDMILPIQMSELGGGGAGGSEWLLPGSPLLFQDRMMSGCDAVTGEHSYSSQQDAPAESQITDDAANQFVLPDIKMEEEDLDSEIFSAVPVATATGQTELRPKEIKGELSRISSPLEETTQPTAAPIGRILSASTVKRKAPRSPIHPTSTPNRSTGHPINVDPSIIGVVAQSSASVPANSPSTSVLKTVVSVGAAAVVPSASSSPLPGAPIPSMGPLRVKLEPGLNCLPPSPPSSVSNDSESDEGLYPHGASDGAGVSGNLGHQASQSSTKCRKSSAGGASAQLASQLISSQNTASRSGALVLTEEERRTLIAEGYPVPTRLPLSKAEERSLKKIRRKIKNKISAQESRRKKKEYMDALEKRVEILTAQQCEMRSRYERLERTNRELVEQLRALQSTLEDGVTTEENVEDIINITDLPS